MADDFDFEAWAEQQTPEVRSAFAGTCAARAMPAIGGFDRPRDFTENRFDLILCRAILTSVVRGVYLTTDVISAIPAATAAADSAHSVFLAASTAVSAADSSFSAAFAARSAAGSADSIFYTLHSIGRSADSAAHSSPKAAFIAARSAANSAAQSAARSAAKDGVKSLFTEPLWFGNDMTNGLREMWPTLRNEWRENGHMSFWIDWYEGLLEGRAPDWELWRRIAEIDNDKWDSGPEAVAAEIDRIKGELAKERDHSTASKNLINRKTIASPAAKKLADLIEKAEQEYKREISNCIPESIEPLVRLPETLRRISAVLDSNAPETEQIEQLNTLVGVLIDTVHDINGRLARANRIPLDLRNPDANRIKAFIAHGTGGWMQAIPATLIAFLGLMATPAADASGAELDSNTLHELPLCQTELDDKSNVPLDGSKPDAKSAKGGKNHIVDIASRS